MQNLAGPNFLPFQASQGGVAGQPPNCSSKYVSKIDALGWAKFPMLRACPGAVAGSYASPKIEIQQTKLYHN